MRAAWQPAAFLEPPSSLRLIPGRSAPAPGKPAPPFECVPRGNPWHSWSLRRACGSFLARPPAPELLVDRDRDQQHDALDEDLPERLQPDEIHAVLEHCEERDAEEGADQVPAAADERSTADDHGADDQQLVAGAGLSRRRPVRGRDDETRERRGGAGEDVDRRADAAGPDADALRRHAA